jgi:hemerythrin-like domain-containing protein
MNATESLRRDHRLILRVLVCFDRLLDEGVRTGAIADGPAREAIEFLEVFGDGIHHAKEEDVLFPALRRDAASRRAEARLSLEALLRDHDVGRRGLEGLRDNLAGASRGQAEAVKAWLLYGRNLCDGWRRHMAHEEEVLFPLAERGLDPVAAGLVAERCRAAEQSWSAETRRRMRSIAERLGTRFGVREADLVDLGRGRAGPLV